MKVDIIIPNFNGSHLIKENLPHVIEALKEFDGEIIIVDDGSTNTDKESLRKIVKDISRVRLIEHERNKGFSSAINTGVKNSNATYVVFLNSDVRPGKDFLQSPIDRLNRDLELFAVGCMDESVEGGKTILRGRGLAKWKNGMLVHRRGEVNASDTFWVSGGSSVVRRDMFEKLGGMDELYNPFYWEDIDLSYRAQKAGFKILFDNKSIVAHFHEEGAIKKSFSNTQITVTAYRNQFIFIWKNITDWYFIINHLLYIPINFISALKRGDFNFIRGFFLALNLLPAIMGRRSKQVKGYRVTDRFILERFQ